jgi:hypothetical protein
LYSRYSNSPVKFSRVAFFSSATKRRRNLEAVGKFLRPSVLAIDESC